MSSVERQQWWQHKPSIESVRDFAILRGLLIRSSDEPEEARSFNIPLSLLPYKFPRDLFQLSSDIAPGINEVLDGISRDPDFLESVLRSAMKTDHFTKRLFDIHVKVMKNNVQTCTLGLIRSDYMVELDKSEDKLRLRQIEINTIASGLFGLSQDRIQEFHKYVCSRYCTTERQPQIAHNTSLTDVTEGIACAWKEYAKQSYVLFVVLTGETNIFDHRCLEYELWTKHGIPSVRKTLTQISEEAFLGTNKELILKSGEEISVIYYRAGYSPSQYPTEKEWEARLLMESSRASNCPMITYQLVGTKKVQQTLASKGVLERFLSDTSMVEKIRSTFAGLYSLEREEGGDLVIEKALKEPEKFVAKPQREGGGNNLYDDDVRSLLERIRDSDERSAYILMDRVHPVAQAGFILGPGANSTTPVQLISELGLFGVFVRRGEKVLMNKAGGYLLRSKPSHLNEGGVCGGGGCVDSPDLVPDEELVRHLQNKCTNGRSL